MVNLIDTQTGVIPSSKTKVPHPPKAEKSPISVNGVVISREAIGAEVQQHPADSPAQAYDQAARALVVRELLLQEARALNIVGTPEALGEGLRELDSDAAIRELLEQEVSTPRADADACKRYYEAHRQKFSSETIYEARHILISASPDDVVARAKAEAEATAILAELDENQMLFEKLALTHSACPSKTQGGSLGQLTKGSTVPEFESVLFELKAGQTASEPVATRFGFHVIKLERIIKGEQLPFEHVQERIAAWLEASSWSRAVAQYISILAGKAQINGIEINAAETPLVQ